MGVKPTLLEHRFNFIRPSEQAVRTVNGVVPGERTYAVFHAGGPAPGSNAAIMGIVNAAKASNTNVVGFLNGCEGMLAGDAVNLNLSRIYGIEKEGGVAIGTSRKNPNSAERADLIRNLRSWGIDGLIAIGGDDTNTTASRLALDGFPVIGIPKTIDNDIPGTAKTHGWDTVVHETARLLRALKLDAQCQDIPSLFIAEIMGRKSGAWTMEAARAAGATAVFIPEEFSLSGIKQILSTDFETKDFILARVARMMEVNGQILDTINFIKAVDSPAADAGDFKLNASKLADEIIKVMENRIKSGPSYGLFVVAEGIADKLPTEASAFDDEQRPTKFRVLGLGEEKEIKVDAHHNPRLSDVKIGAALEKLVKKAGADIKGLKVVSERFGYALRCIDPIACDVDLGLSEGEMAVSLLNQGLSGKMVSVKGDGSVGYVDYDELPKDETGHLKPRSVRLDGVSYQQSVTMQKNKGKYNGKPFGS